MYSMSSTLSGLMTRFYRRQKMLLTSIHIEKIFHRLPIGYPMDYKCKPSRRFFLYEYLNLFLQFHVIEEQQLDG